MTGRVAALVPAAGQGVRLGPGPPKVLRELRGLPMLVYAVRALAAAESVDLVVVAAPPSAVDSCRELLSAAAGLGDLGLLVVAGGATRTESVGCALAALPADVSVVLVHDAARPLAPPELIEAVTAAVRAGHEAVVPVLPLVDTVKRVDPAGWVTETVRRAELRRVQTPQGFTRTLLVEAYAKHQSQVDVTDDAGLVELLDRPVWTVQGHEEAFKVTGAADLVLAEAVLAARDAG